MSSLHHQAPIKKTPSRLAKFRLDYELNEPWRSVRQTTRARAQKH